MIITQFGDTLNKKIIFSTKRYMFYVDSNYYGKYFIKAIKKRRMTESKMNVYRVDRNTAMMNQRAMDVMGNAFMLQGGVHLAITPYLPDSNATESEKQFFRDLQLGYSFNASAYLRIRPHSLVGIVVDNFHSSAFISKLDFHDGNGNIQHATDVKATLNLLYIGPEYMLFRDSKQFKHFFMMSFGAGYARFMETGRVGTNENSFSAGGGGIRFSLSKTWAIGSSLIIGPNFKFVIPILADHRVIIGAFPHFDLGLSILIH